MRYHFTILSFLLLCANGIQAQDYILSSGLTQITDCGGFILDSGGNNGDYGSNENHTVTICPDTNVGTHVQLIFSGWQLEDGDVICFFDGMDNSAPFLGCTTDFEDGAAFIIQATAPNTDGCLTMTFTSDAAGEGAGWSAAINCVQACQTIIAVLTDSDPAVMPVDTGWIDVCPGDRVFFAANGEYPQDGAVYNHSDFTSDFTWDFGDGGTSFGLNVFHVFEEPGGYIVQLKITDQLGCSNTNFVSQRIRVAPKPSFSVGDFPTEVCMNDTLQLNAGVSGSGGNTTIQVDPVISSFQSTVIRSDSLPMPDGNGLSYETSISFFDFTPGQILTNINDLLGIWITAEHSWMRDIEISLTCPNGQSAILHDHPGQVGGQVFLGIPFENDEGLAQPIPGTGYEYGWQPNPDFNMTWIEYANANNPATLPSGTYNSFDPLENFLGCPLNGEWTITVTDLWAVDNGFIFNWSIGFAEDLYPALETFRPEIISGAWGDHPSIYQYDIDSISASPNSAGQVGYVYNVEDEYGCTWDTSISVQVLPFAHPDCYSCVDLLDTLPDLSICEGDAIEIDATSPFQDTTITFESYENYPLGNGNHPPINPFKSTILVNSVIPVTVLDPMTDIISVCIDMETDFNADLSFFLEAPNGQLLELSTLNGGGQDNYTNTCFTPTAVTPITAGTPPFTGDFQPEGDWSILQNSPVNGDWTMQVTDAFGLTALGNFNWWTITFRATDDIIYEWSPNNGLSCVDCPVPTATPASTQDYDLMLTNSYGCMESDAFTLNVLSIFSAPTVNCQELPGGQMSINWNIADPGTMYEVNINGTGWELPNDGPTGHLIDGLLMGDQINAEVRAITMGLTCTVDIGSTACTYTLCPISTEIMGQAPYLNSCFNSCDASVTIDTQVGTGPFSFVVTNLNSGDSFTQDTPVLTDLCPGNYEVLVTDVIGCNEVIGFEIVNKEELQININIDQSVQCFDSSDAIASASATGGTADYTFIWSDQAQTTGPFVENLPPGAITVTVEDANGCLATDTEIILAPSEMQLDFTTTAISCFGISDGSATVIPSGGTPPYDFAWDGGNTPTQATTILVPEGTISVVVTDNNGCETTGTTAISAPTDPLLVSATQTFIDCFGQNQHTGEAMATGGSGNYTFNWQPSGLNGSVASGLSTGLAQVIVTDDNGCMDSVDLDVVEWPLVEFDLIGSAPDCYEGTNGMIEVNNLTGGTGTGYSYQWNTGANTPLIDGLSAAAYSLLIVDDQGCEGTADLTLNAPAEMMLTSNVQDALCSNSASGEICISNVINGNGTISYQWNNAANNQTSACASQLFAGTYSVVVTDANNCTISADFVVGEDTPIVLDVSTMDNPCFGYEEGRISISATGGSPNYQYDWSNGALTEQLTNLPAGNYEVTVTDQNNCTATTAVTINQPTAVSGSLNSQSPNCFGDSDGRISVDMTGGTLPYSYSLNNGPFNANPNFLALSAGDYAVQARDANDCIYSFNSTLTEPAELSVNITADNQTTDEIIVNYGENIQLAANVNNGVGSLQFEWQAGWCGSLSCIPDSTDCSNLIDCPQPIATVTNSNDYYLLITDSNGCIAEDHIQVHASRNNPVDVPTGFSPNNDQLNDLLLVHGRSGTNILLFQVFDRWGELVYQDGDFMTNDSSRGWDGTFKSSPMPAGVYIWYMEVEYPDGNQEELKGHSTLIR